MYVIHKEIISITDLQNINIKGFYKILSFTIQRNELVMYFIRNDSEQITSNILIRIHGTGHPVNPDKLLQMEFQGTYLQSDGQLVWHVWTEILK